MSFERSPRGWEARRWPEPGRSVRMTSGPQVPFEDDKLVPCPPEPTDDATLREADDPRLPSADRVMRNLDEAEEDEAAGRFTDGSALLAELRQMAARLEAKIARRRA